MKKRALIALVATAIATLYVIFSFGPKLIFAGIAHAGIGGLGLLCGNALIMFGVLAAAWNYLLPRDRRARLRTFFLGRLVRDSISDITPFSLVAGMFAAARVAMLDGMEASYAVASVAADATTEAMAQVVFLALGILLSTSHFRHHSGIDPLVTTAIIVLTLAVPCIFGIIVLQREGAEWGENIIRRLFPKAQRGATFHQSVNELYSSWPRLAKATSLHLVGWISAGGGTYFAFWLAGGRMSVLDALALESLVSTLRSLAAFVPAAIGVQEAGYAVLSPMFGMPPELGLAVSLLRRAREVVLGVPALIYWQAIEGHNALKAGSSRKM